MGAAELAGAAGTPVSGGGLDRTQEVAVPSEVGAAHAASSAKKQPSAGRRRSHSRTPGTKIAIIEQGTQTTPGAAGAGASAAKHAAAVQVRWDAGSLGGLRPNTTAAKVHLWPSSWGLAAPSLHLTHYFHPLQHLLQAGRPATTPRLLSTIAQKTEAEDLGGDVEQEACSAEGGSASDDGSLEAPVAAAAVAADTVPLKQYQRVVVKAKAYHAEARQLGASLRRVTAKAAKLKKAASALRWVMQGRVAAALGVGFVHQLSL